MQGGGTRIARLLETEELRDATLKNSKELH